MSTTSSLKGFFTTIVSFIMSQLCPSSDPPPSSPSTDDPEAQPAATIADQQNPNQILLQWENVVMPFCFASAIQLAILSAQTKSPLSVPFYLLCFLILIIFLILFVAISIGHKFTVASHVLRKVAIIIAITSIILAITIPYPLWLKCTTWVLYALSLLVVVICNKF